MHKYRHILSNCDGCRPELSTRPNVVVTFRVTTLAFSKFGLGWSAGISHRAYIMRCAGLTDATARRRRTSTRTSSTEGTSRHITTTKQINRSTNIRTDHDHDTSRQDRVGCDAKTYQECRPLGRCRDYARCSRPEITESAGCFRVERTILNARPCLSSFRSIAFHHRGVDRIPGHDPESLTIMGHS